MFAVREGFISVYLPGIRFDAVRDSDNEETSYDQDISAQIPIRRKPQDARLEYDHDEPEEHEDLSL